MKVKVICPQCRTVLSFEDKDNNIQGKLIACPKCGFQGELAAYNKFTTGTVPATKLPEQEQGNTMSIGYLITENENTTFQLIMGSNIIGRIADTGNANVKINRDPYMSRLHLQINVIRNPHGKLEHQLIELDNKNPTLLNGKTIPKGQIPLLQHQDILTLGKTNLRFIQN